MFDKDLHFYGKHADYLRILAPSKQYKEKSEQRRTFFNSNIEAILAAAVIGFIKQRKAEVSRDKEIADNNIMLEAVTNHREELELVYRLIMLLDDKEHLSLDERINKAFKYDNNEEMRKSGDAVFWSYVRGGIEYLYDTLWEESLNTQEDIQKAVEFIVSFKSTYVEDDIMGKINDLCKQAGI